MRVSADQNDPDFIPDYTTARVFLDGVELLGRGQDHAGVISADDVAGVVVVLSVNEKGDPFVDPRAPGQLAIETRTGVVRIERPNNPDAPPKPDFLAINRSFSS
jgi:hypothetical protein